MQRTDTKTDTSETAAGGGGAGGGTPSLLPLLRGMLEISAFALGLLHEGGGFGGRGTLEGGQGQENLASVNLALMGAYDGAEWSSESPRASAVAEHPLVADTPSPKAAALAAAAAMARSGGSVSSGGLLPSLALNPFSTMRTLGGALLDAMGRHAFELEARAPAPWHTLQVPQLWALRRAAAGRALLHEVHLLVGAAVCAWDGHADGHAGGARQRQLAVDLVRLLLQTRPRECAAGMIYWWMCEGRHAGAASQGRRKAALVQLLLCLGDSPAGEGIGQREGAGASAAALVVALCDVLAALYKCAREGSLYSQGGGGTEAEAAAGARGTAQAQGAQRSAARALAAWLDFPPLTGAAAAPHVRTSADWPSSGDDGSGDVGGRGVPESAWHCALRATRGASGAALALIYALAERSSERPGGLLGRSAAATMGAQGEHAARLWPSVLGVCHEAMHTALRGCQLLLPPPLLLLRLVECFVRRCPPGQLGTHTATPTGGGGGGGGGGSAYSLGGLGSLGSSSSARSTSAAEKDVQDLAQRLVAQCIAIAEVADRGAEYSNSHLRPRTACRSSNRSRSRSARVARGGVGEWGRRRVTLPDRATPSPGLTPFCSLAKCSPLSH